MGIIIWSHFKKREMICETQFQIPETTKTRFKELRKEMNRVFASIIFFILHVKEHRCGADLHYNSM